MSQHARIEEVYDSSEESDPMDMDPSDFEPVSNKFPLQPATSRRNDQSSLINPSSIPSSSLQQQPPPTQNPNQFASTGDLEKFRHYQCIYPVYFDKTRSRAEGRRVGKKLAVENPLARGMVDAVQELGLNALFEPGKVHPKDWSNPGRVKVLVKQNGRAVNPRVKNSQSATPFFFSLPNPRDADNGSNSKRTPPLHARLRPSPCPPHHRDVCAPITCPTDAAA